VLGNGGDGLNDILYTTSADGLTTHLVADVNDNGLLDANDLVLAFDGNLAFAASDFVAEQFTVSRGTTGDDVIDGTAVAETIFGVAGNDRINGLGAVTICLAASATTRWTAAWVPTASTAATARIRSGRRRQLQ
jgi:hypothetical protein